MDIIDEANRYAYRETQFLIKKAREEAKKSVLSPTGVCYNCKTKLKKKSENKLFCDEDCRDDYTYLQERKKANGK